MTCNRSVLGPHIQFQSSDSVHEVIYFIVCGQLYMSLLIFTVILSRDGLILFPKLAEIIGIKTHCQNKTLPSDLFIYFLIKQFSTYFTTLSDEGICCSKSYALHSQASLQKTWTHSKLNTMFVAGMLVKDAYLDHMLTDSFLMMTLKMCRK